eukprot:COSAG01_NODE_6583_length_3593_cov_42.311391_2_plen_284_part_00
MAAPRTDDPLDRIRYGLAASGVMESLVLQYVAVLSIAQARKQQQRPPTADSWWCARAPRGDLLKDTRLCECAQRLLADYDVTELADCCGPEMWSLVQEMGRLQVQASARSYRVLPPRSPCIRPPRVGGGRVGWIELLHRLEQYTDGSRASDHSLVAIDALADSGGVRYEGWVGDLQHIERKVADRYSCYSWIKTEADIHAEVLKDLERMRHRQKVVDARARGDRSHAHLVAIDAVAQELSYPGLEADIADAEKHHERWPALVRHDLEEMRRRQRLFDGPPRGP